MAKAGNIGASALPREISQDQFPNRKKRTPEFHDAVEPYQSLVLLTVSCPFLSPAFGTVYKCPPSLYGTRRRDQIQEIRFGESYRYINRPGVLKQVCRSLSSPIERVDVHTSPAKLFGNHGQNKPHRSGAAGWSSSPKLWPAAAPAFQDARA